MLGSLRFPPLARRIQIELAGHRIMEVKTSQINNTLRNDGIFDGIDQSNLPETRMDKGFQGNMRSPPGTKNSFEITTQYLMTSVAFRYSRFLS